MRKTCGPVVLILAFTLSVLSAVAQQTTDELSPEARQKLIQKVTSAILKLPNFGVFDNIEFSLQGRTVVLMGQVANSNLKPDADRAVKKIEGVDKVVNNIEALPPSPLDDRLRRQVYNAIYEYGPFITYKNNPVNPPIRIIVKSARVTLEGVVNTEQDKNVCTIRVNQVPDVLSVTNNLRVLKPSQH